MFRQVLRIPVSLLMPCPLTSLVYVLDVILLQFDTYECLSQGVDKVHAEGNIGTGVKIGM